MMATYIGEDCVYADPISAKSIMLENNKQYNIDTRYDGPTIIVNNQQVVSPNATTWVIVDGVNIPYAPQLIQNFWKVES